MAEAYIVAAARTAGARKGGRVAGCHRAELAGSVLNALIERSGTAPDQIEHVIMGCVMQAGEQSNNVARNAIMASKLPESVPGASIDRQCGSSQQALHFAAQAVMSGSMDCVIAAGVESMTRVPMGLASQLPAKNGFGTYKSPNIEKRYPNIVFSQFTGAEMMAENTASRGTTWTNIPTTATSARLPQPKPANSRTRSFRCRSRAPMVRPTPTMSTKASASTSALMASRASN